MTRCMAAAVVAVASAHAAYATGTEPEKEPPFDPAPCLAAISANDDETIAIACGVLIGNGRTAKPDLIKALIARAGVFSRKGQIDRAIADDDTVLRLDPSLADVYNSRGELWWKKGERPKALADFAAALKLYPDHPAARSNYRALAQELERLGAMMAVDGRPSFNCAAARRAVEKAICADRDLANLDREIYAANIKAARAAAA
ncbi:tetratricopeptide repeat protein, partial [Bradyrhizobium sp.]|uniref:tetratricopeptide repeat protein n=1 Tax=Bradyrhizobium sp. TaxID=376 RepID=UPI003C6ECD61